MRYGSGKYTYELVENWAKLPAGWSFIDVGGISIDDQDRLYILNRGPHPVIVMDRDGKFLDRGEKATSNVRTAAGSFRAR